VAQTALRAGVNRHAAGRQQCKVIRKRACPPVSCFHELIHNKKTKAIKSYLKHQYKIISTKLNNTTVDLHEQIAGNVQIFWVYIIVLLRHRNKCYILRYEYQYLEIKTYLPGAGESVISEADPPGRGPSIALRLG